MIIDTHTHFYDPSRPEGIPWPPADNKLLYRTVLPDHCKALAEPEGVVGTVVVEASNRVEDNQWILDLAADEPFIVGFVGNLSPADPGFLEHLERFAANPLYRGIRIGGGRNIQQIESGAYGAQLEALADRDLTLDLLVRTPELPAVCDLAARIPGLRIVLDHIVHVPIDGNPPDPEWVSGMQAVGRHPNVYCKVSALPEQAVEQPAPRELAYYMPTLDALWDAFGEDRLVYGSNWPVCERAADYGSMISVVKEYFGGKGEEAYRKYFRDNGQAAYRWLKRG